MSKKKMLQDFLSFDWETYVKTYDDLIYIKSKQEAWYHWINYGKHENRNIKNNDNKNNDNKNKKEYINFDWKFYINTYDDLKHLQTKEEAWNHWIKHGKNENRIIKNTNTIHNIKNKNQHENDKYINFDWKFYINTYNDLKHLKTKEEAWNHWIKHGKNENRICKNIYLLDDFTSFDWKSYITNYEDLKNLHTKKEAWNHWIKYGKNENRICKNIYSFDDFITFDWECYIKNYEDLKNLQTKEEAWKHFIFYGFSEGRQLNNIKETELKEFKKIIEYENNIADYDFSVDTIYFKKKYTNCGKHLFGWKSSINYLLEHIDLSGSIFDKKYYFDEWIEKLLLWGNKLQSQTYLDVIREKKLQLISFLHNPPFENYIDVSNNKGLLLNNNDLLNENIIKIINTNLFNSISFLYVLSIYHKNYIINNYPQYTNKILSLNHPIDIDNIKNEEEFNIHNFKDNKTFFHIGWWLRNFNTFIEFEIPENYKKIILVKNEFKEHFDTQFTNIDNSIKINYELNDSKYIEIFNNSCIFCDLYDCVANNLVLECIKYNTPIIIKRLPSVEEYLGINYPLFFDNSEDLIQYNNEKTLIKKMIEANIYLKKMDKTPFMLKTFCNKLTYDTNKLKIKNDNCKLTWLYYLNNEDIDIEKYIYTFNNQHIIEEINLIIINSISSKIELLEKNKSDNITIINVDNNLNMYEIYNIFIENATTEYLIFKRFNDMFLNNKNYSNLYIDYLENNKTFDIIILKNKKTVKETDVELMDNIDIQNYELNNSKIDDAISISTQITNKNSDLTCKSNKIIDSENNYAIDAENNYEIDDENNYEIDDENNYAIDAENNYEINDENSITSDLTNETSIINKSDKKNQFKNDENLLQFSQIDIFNDLDKDILWRKSIHSYVGNFNDNFWIHCFKNHLNIFTVDL